MSPEFDSKFKIVYSSTMIHQPLINTGLTPEQSQIYLSLINHGPQTASSLAKHTDIKRTYIYKICQELEKQHLIYIAAKNKTTTFFPLSPSTLLNNLQEKKIQIESAQTSLESLLPSLLSKYLLNSTKPNISYYEGISGINKSYSDILKKQKDVVILRPKHNSEYKKYKEIIKIFLKQQVKKNIHAQVISPFKPTSLENFLHTDKKNLIQRHFTQNPRFTFPCQIMIFDDEVAIISFDNPLITTIIENKKISQTFKQIFDLLWSLTESEHQKIINQK